MKPDSFLDPSAIKKQCDDAINDLQSQNQKIDTYKKTIDGFLREPYIKSGSYEVTRQLLEDRKLAFEVERYANELDIVDWNTYKDIVGNEVLDGAVVTKKEKALERKAEVKSKIASLNVQRSAYIEAGFFTNAVDSQIRAYEAELEELEAVIAECDRIIGLYDLIEARSASLFRMGSQLCALANRVNCEIDAAYNGTGNLDGIDESLRLRMVEVCSVKQMGEIISDQFGFDDRTTKIMSEVYQNIQEVYSDETQQERDWRFTRSISQLKYNALEVTKGYETLGWAQGAGAVYPISDAKSIPPKPEKEYFCETLNINEVDYMYLRYMVRLQNTVTSSPDTYGSMAMESLFQNRKKDDDFYVWKNTMKEHLFMDLSDKEYKDLYVNKCKGMEGNGDFAHMFYTVSAGIVPQDTPIVINYNPAGAPGMTWANAEERLAVTGWLGDAVFTGTKKKTSFGNDDYIADLDADNIVNRTRNGEDLVICINDYYKKLQHGDEHVLRTSEFLQNHPYEEIENAIKSRCTLYTTQTSEGFDVNPSAHMEIESRRNPVYEETFGFLDKLKEVKGQK